MATTPLPRPAAKYTPDGQPVWVRAITGSYKSAQISDLAIDSTGNVAITGSAYAAPYSFEGGLSSGGGAFLTKFSREGKALWVNDLDQGSV